MTSGGRNNVLGSLAGALADSPLLARGKRLFEQNQKNWLLPLSKWDKLLCGGYIILKDYAAGRFPPKSGDRLAAYEAEADYRTSLPGVTVAEVEAGEIRKPFWDSRMFGRYARHFERLLRCFEQVGVPPGSRLLELGCGGGWMAEFFALCGFSVVGTSLVRADIEVAQRRVAAVAAKGATSTLSFVVAPMETVDRFVPEAGSYDCVYVFEALHHAFDWRETLAAASRCLKPGGWFVLANEPNRLHTFTSYRVGRISNTHEIGLNRRELVRALHGCGFKNLRILQPRFDDFISAHWIAAQK